MRVISSTQLDYARTVQASWAADGTPLPLSNVLQHLNYLPPSELLKIQAETAKRRRNLHNGVLPAPTVSSAVPFTAQSAPTPPTLAQSFPPDEDDMAPPPPSTSNPMDAWGSLSAELDMAPPDPHSSEDWSSLETSGEVEAHIHQTWRASAPTPARKSPETTPVDRTNRLKDEVTTQQLGKGLPLEEQLIGQNLGQYKIEKKIGEGGRGIVFRANQESMSRLVAIKVLSEAVAADPVNLARFRQEALAAGKITHRYVVGAIDYGQENGLHYMVMPFIKGQTCEDRMKSVKRSGFGFIVKLTLQIAQALEAIEDHGIIHRDIKPGNVMIREDGDACLMDLGLAKSMSVDQTLTAIGNTVGTPDYMSPEQCLGRKLSIKTDVYALGATIYHLLTGQPPFKADSALYLMKKQVKAPTPYAKDVRSEVPSPIAKLIQHMMAKDPGKRPKPSLIINYCQKMLDRAMEQSAGGDPRKKSPKKNKSSSGKKAKRARQTPKTSGSRHRKKVVKPEAPKLEEDNEEKRGGSERRVNRPRRRRRSGNTMVLAVGLLFAVVVGVAAIFLLLSKQPS
jgi:serine/threonine protein kinase